MLDLKKSVVPEFTSRKDEWDRYRRLYDGGQAIISQLPKISTAETEENYKNRQKYAVNLANPSNEVQRQKDVLTLSDFEIKTDNDKLNQFLQSGVDGGTKTFTQWMIDDVLGTALVYGRCFPVVDRAILEGPITEAQAEMQDNPYSYVLSPLQVPAWTYADNSCTKLIQAISLVKDVSKVDELGFAEELDDVYTLWRANEIQVQYESDSMQDVVKANPLGIIPISIFQLKDSFFHDIWYSVLTSMQHFTIASKAGQNQIGMLIVSSDKAIPQIDVGNFSALRIPEKASSKMEYSSVEGIQKNLDIADMLKSQIGKQLKNNMATMSLETIQQSGVSKKQDQLVQEAFSSYCAHSLVAYAPQVLDLYAAFLGINQYSVDAIIPEEFVSKSLDEDRLRLETLTQSYKPQTAKEYVAWAKETRDLSGIERKMDLETITEDDAEIEAQAQAKFNAISEDLSQDLDVD